ncbi:fungal-specific transcription factor domain-containing protein [Irpex lacteus]|nr:fungal-specific transcription factor domain-containing protein [Irpex lacteus]
MVRTSQNTPADTPEPQVGSRRKAEDDEHSSRSQRRREHGYSCGECHRRKQKCDRQIPCSHVNIVSPLGNIPQSPRIMPAIPPGKSDQDLHARLARVEQAKRSWSPSPGIDDDKNSQADEDDVSGASGSVAASAMLEKLQNVVDTKPPDHEATPNPLSVDQLPSDIFRNDANAALLVSSDSSPADNLKALVQECGVAPHKISELLHELPPRQLTDKLVDVYFTGINWTRYPISEKNFRAGYSSIYNDGAAVNPNEFRFLPLLFVILALQSGDTRTRRLTSQRYYWCSRRSLLIAAAIHTDCLEVVITRLLSARFLLFDRKMTECWSQLGAAVRTAQALGLHRDCGSLQGLDPFQVEHRRRIWSYLYHADRSYALVLGRPSAIQDDYTSTLSPANVEDENNVLVRGPFPLTTPTKMTFVVLRHTLAGIMGRISHFFQKVNSPRHYSDVLALDDELVKFTQSLPPYYSLDPDTSLDETNFYIPAHRFLLVTEILFVRITLHRPFLLRRLSSDKYLRSRKACFECAMQDFGILRDPVTSAYREFQAAMISGIYLVLYPKGREAETMSMIVEGFIQDHDQHMKGSPKTEDMSTMPSPSVGDKPHNEAQLLLQLSNSSPRSGYNMNAPRVAGPNFPSNGSTSGSQPQQVQSPVSYALSPAYANSSPLGAPAIPAVQNLQRSDSVSVGGSPGHEEESAAHVFSSGPVISTDRWRQSLPWATPGISDMSGS